MSAMKHQHGFTLVELIIVAVIMAIMAVAVAPVALSSLRAYDSTLSDVIVLDKLRYATERLAREIREVKFDTSTTPPSYQFTSMGTNSMVFKRCYFDTLGIPHNNSSGTPVDCTSAPSAAPTTVTINTTPTSSTSCVSVPCVTLNYSDMTGTVSQVLTDQLSLLAFNYYNAAGCGTDTPDTPCTPTAATVSSVKISLTLIQNGQPYSQETSVKLRNQ